MERNLFRATAWGDKPAVTIKVREDHDVVAAHSWLTRNVGRRYDQWLYPIDNRYVMLDKKLAVLFKLTFG